MHVQPFISIIVPTRNRAALLVEAIESIRQQTYIHWELIIVSDASDDNTASVIKSIVDNRIFFFELPFKSNGPGTVRNFGIQKAGGNFIAFCDDDDQWLPDKLLQQVAYLQTHKEIEVLATQTFYFEQMNALSFKKQLPFKQRLAGNKLVNKKWLLPFFNCFTLSSVIVKKELLLSANLFSEEAAVQGHEDFDLWLRILPAARFAVIPLILTAYRIHPKQITSSVERKAYKKQAMLILKNHSVNHPIGYAVAAHIRLLVYKIIHF